MYFSDWFCFLCCKALSLHLAAVFLGVLIVVKGNCSICFISKFLKMDVFNHGKCIIITLYFPVNHRCPDFLCFLTEFLCTSFICELRSMQRKLEPTMFFPLGHKKLVSKSMKFISFNKERFVTCIYQVFRFRLCR